MPQQKPVVLGDDAIAVGDDAEFASPEFTPTEEPGFLASLWQKANEPMTRVPSELIRSVTELPNQSQEIADLLGLGSVYGAWDRIQRGGLEVAGDITSGLTSPLNAALTVSTLGTGTAARAGMGGLATGLNYVTKALSAPVAAEGAIDTFSPDSSLGERGLGLLEMIGGVAGVRSKVGKVSAKPEMTVEEAKTVLSKPKRNLKLNQDGTFTDKETGEIIGKDGKTVVSNSDPNFNQGEGNPELAGSKGYVKIGDDAVAIADDLPLHLKAETKPIAVLPSDLQGAKPRFNIGYNTYEPKFANDLDKALYIIAQTKASKRDADYLKFVIEQTGLDEAGARALGQDVRNHVRNTVREAEPGVIEIPSLSANNPNVKTVTLTTAPVVKPEAPLTAPVSVTPSFGGSKGNKALPKTEKVPPDVMLEVQKTVPDATPDEVVKHLGYVTDKQNTSKITEAINFSRALKTSIDLSAPLRQGLPLALRSEFYTSLWPMVKSLGSEKAFRLSQDEIASRPLFRSALTNTTGKATSSFAEDAGLFLSDLTDLSRREEAIASTWAEKIPGVRMSNRAYTTFLNRLRADTFENLVKSTGAESNPALAKDLASFINNATGRGSLGELERIAPILNGVLFSPRFISSRLQMFRPDKFISAPTAIKKEIAKSFIATIGTGIAMGEVAKLGGGKVSNDPTSSDFRKIRIGDEVRIDPFAGYQQYAVAASRIAYAMHQHYIEGKKVNRFQKPDMVALNFLRFKTSPVISGAWDTLLGTDYKGDKVTLPGELKDLFVPMFLETLVELYQEDPELLPWAVPAGLGMGVNVGGPGSKK